MFVFIISSDKEYENLPYPFSKSIWFILWYVLLLQMIHYLPRDLLFAISVLSGVSSQLGAYL